MDGTIDDSVDDRDRLHALLWPPGEPADLAVVLDRVCRVSVAELELRGAAVSLLPSSGSHVVAAASDALPARSRGCSSTAATAPAATPTGRRRRCW